MRLRTFIGIVAGILLSVPVHAQKNSVKVYDKERQQTVTATAITPDIVRIDIVPDGGKANTLPTLLSDDALKASQPQTTIKNVDNITLMNAASICQFINGGVVGRGLSTRKVGIIMQRLGFKKVHTMQGNFFEVFQIPADQIQATLAMADEAEANANDPAPTFEEASLPF